MGFDSVTLKDDFMKKTAFPVSTLAITAILALSALPIFAQNNQGSQNGEPLTTIGWRGFLSIDYKGSKFIVPYARIVSLSQNTFLVDGGGKVEEVTIDTTGGAIARFYFLGTAADDSPLKSVGVLNDRLKDLSNRAEDKTGQDIRTVVKNYPTTTHAKTIEFNLSHKSHLGEIFSWITREWIEEAGRGTGKTLKIE